MVQLKIREWIGKYRYVLLILLAGLALMLLPTSSGKSEMPTVPEPEPETMESRLEKILSRIQGAGQVAVMLTEADGGEVVYQTDGEGGDTVLVTDSARNEQGLVRTSRPPVYQGAIVVCSGADSPSVCLAITEAVADVTGLGMDRITVLKLE